MTNSNSGDGPGAPTVLGMPETGQGEIPEVQTVRSRGGWVGPFVVLVVALVVGGAIFVSSRSSDPEVPLLLVPTDIYNGAQVGNLYLASLDEERSDENRLLRNVAPWGTQISLLEDGDVESYWHFGMEYEGGRLLTYLAEGSSTGVVAHLKDGELTEIASGEGSPLVYRAGGRLVAFFHGGLGCEAFGFSGLEAELIGNATECLPSENYVFLIDFDGSRRSVSRYDLATGELTKVAEADNSVVVSVSPDGSLLAMDSVSPIFEGEQQTFEEGAIEAYSVDSAERLDLGIDGMTGTITVVTDGVLDDGLLLASFETGSAGLLTWVPADGGSIVEIGETETDFALPNPSGDAVLSPGSDIVRLAVLTPEVEIFEFETDGEQGAIWVDSETALWVDDDGDVHTASTDGTTNTVGNVEFDESVFTERRDGRILIQTFSDGDSLGNRFYVYDGALVKVDIQSLTAATLIDGPEGLTIGASEMFGFRENEVGVVDLSTGAFEPFDSTLGAVVGLTTEGSTVTYSLYPEDLIGHSTHVVDLSDPSAIEVEVYEDVIRLSDEPTVVPPQLIYGTTQLID